LARGTGVLGETAEAAPGEVTLWVRFFAAGFSFYKNVLRLISRWGKKEALVVLKKKKAPTMASESSAGWCRGGALTTARVPSFHICVCVGGVRKYSHLLF